MISTDPANPLAEEPGALNADMKLRVAISCIVGAVAGALLSWFWQQAPGLHGLITLLALPIAVAICIPLRLGANARRTLHPATVIPACATMFFLTLLILSLCKPVSDKPLVACCLLAAGLLAAAGVSISVAAESSRATGPCVDAPEPADSIDIAPEIPRLPSVLPPWPAYWGPPAKGKEICSMPQPPHLPTVYGSDNSVRACPTCARTYCRNCILNLREKCPNCGFGGADWPAQV
jgi:hypothetical protein